MVKIKYNSVLWIIFSIILIAILSIIILLLFYSKKNSTKDTFYGGQAVYFDVISIGDQPDFLNQYDIYRLPLNGKPTKITSVNDETRDDKPSFLLLSDQSGILVYSNKKVEKIDLTSGKKSLIYQSDNYNEIQMVLNPDKTLALIWLSSMNDNGFDNYDAKTYNTKTGDISDLGTGTFERGTGFAPDRWIDRQTILFSESTYDYTYKEWVYDPENNKLTDTNFNFHPNDQINGNLDIITADTYPYVDGSGDPCGPYETLPSTYKLQNMNNNARLGSFGFSEKQVKIIHFSPDYSQMLLAVSDFPKIPDECSKKFPAAYYLSTISGNEVQQIDNYQNLLDNWNVPKEAKVRISDFTTSEPNETIYDIKLGDSIIYSLPLSNTRYSETTNLGHTTIYPAQNIDIIGLVN